jgi:ABC-2 type transport system permease protein
VLRRDHELRDLSRVLSEWRPVPIEHLPGVLKPVALANPFSYGVDLLKHALGPEALFDPDFSVGRDLLAMLAFVVLALTIACWRFSQAPVFESLARAFTAPKRH